MLPGNLNHIPLVRLLFFFIIGILSYIFFKPIGSIVYTAFGISFLFYIGCLLNSKLNANYKYRWVIGGVIYLAIFFSGLILAQIQDKQPSISERDISSGDAKLLVGVVDQSITKKKNSLQTILKISFEKKGEPVKKRKERILCFFKKNEKSQRLQIGDVIVLNAPIKVLSPPRNPGEFNYRKYMSFHQVFKQTYLSDDNWKFIRHGSSNNIFLVSDKVRRQLIQRLETIGIQDNELSIISALILGYKNDLNIDLKQAYAEAGVIHVLAVSGLHVGIIFLVLSQLLIFLQRWKYGIVLKGVLVILSIWFYAFLTGLSPSVMRATTMFSFVAIAKILGRDNSFFNTLAASALLLLIINPFLIMDVGFQLSYLAVSGIVIIQPFVSGWFNVKNIFLKKVWDLSAVSIAAQTATFPLTLLYFHQFPNYFLLSNLIVIPLVSIILFVGLTTMAVSFIPLVGIWLAKLLNLLIIFLNSSIHRIQALPYAISQDIPFNVMHTLLIYCFIICTILLVAYRRFKFLFVGVIFLLTFLISSTISDYKRLNTKEIIVYHIPGHSAINFIHGNENLLLSDKELIKDNKKVQYHIRNNWIQHTSKLGQLISIENINKPDNKSSLVFRDLNNIVKRSNYFQISGLRIAVINNNFPPFKTQNKLDLDVVIVSQNTIQSIESLLQAFNPKEIILDSSISYLESKKLKKQCQALNVKCWSVILDGFYSKILE